MARSKSKGKQTKTFLKKGLLEGQIKKRHQTRDFKQKVQNRKVKRNKKGTGHPQHRNEFNEDERDEVDIPLEAKDAMSDVDEQEGDSEPADDSDDSNDTVEALSDDLRDESSDDEDFGDDEKHASDLKALAEKDPNFFKYLQENDAELLKFTTGQAVAEAGDEDSQDSDSDGGLASRRPKGKSRKTEAAPVLTLRIVREWEQHLIKTQSLRTLRKLLIAFRAALASEGGADSAQSDWVVQNPSVFRRVVRTTLKFVPAVLRQRIPVKGDADNKTRKQITSKHRAAAQRLVKSYFVSLHNLTQAVAGDSALVVLAIKESANLFPYILSNRKILRSWTRVLQRLFADGNDEARVAAIAALRTLASSADATCCQDVIKGLYTTLLDATRKTSPYTLPTITFMKNAITQVLLLDTKQAQSVSYRVAFTYIRMLALLLRKAVKEGSPDSLKAVYNWQFVHAIDFWSLLLSSASEAGQESPLRQLIYPLVQTALGAIRLVPTARYFPFRFQVLRSLLRIVKRTGVFLSIVAPLFEVLDCPELTTRLKSSSLKPIDLEYFVRCPSAYLRTRAYADALVDEAVYLMTDYFSAMSTSIAFPELALPTMIGIRKITKRSGQAKLASQMKTLLEKLESNSKWIEQQRENVHFAPQQLDQVDRFLQDVKTDSTPLGAFAKVVQKNRDERRAILDKAAFKVEEEDAA